MPLDQLVDRHGWRDAEVELGLTPVTQEARAPADHAVHGGDVRGAPVPLDVLAQPLELAGLRFHCHDEHCLSGRENGEDAHVRAEVDDHVLGLELEARRREVAAPAHDLAHEPEGAAVEEKGTSADRERAGSSDHGTIRGRQTALLEDRGGPTDDARRVDGECR